jgi:hypothetical protein
MDTPLRMEVRAAPGLRLPPQVAVTRTPVPCAISGVAGVEASFGWGDVWNIVKTVAPIAATALL